MCRPFFVVTALTIVSGFALLDLAHAQDSDLGHRDRTEILYRKALQVDARGDPLIPVAVLRGVTRVHIRSKAPLRVLPSGDEGAEIVVKDAVTLDVTRAKAGTARWFVVLASARSDDLGTLRSARQKWVDRGFEVRAIEAGTTLAMRGRLLDTRRTLLCWSKAFETEALAKAEQERLEQAHGEEIGLQPESISRPSGTLRVGFPGGSELLARDATWFRARGDDVLSFTGTRGGKSITVSVPGRAYAVVDRTAGITIVAEVSLERLVRGVVPSEMFSSSPSEALRAQAITARTELLSKLGTRHTHDPFSFCNEQHCQVYGGAAKEDARINALVEETRGQVIVDPQGKLVDAVFHADCGGHTESNENVWPGRPEPSLRGRPDTDDAAHSPLRDGASDEAVRALIDHPDASWCGRSGYNAKAHRWWTKLDARSVGRLVEPRGKVGVATELRVTARGVSGRAIELEVKGTVGAVRIQGELAIRKILGGLRSALFVVDAEGKVGSPDRTFSFAGAGFGHGVGLCQTGAIGMAKAGRKAADILGQYYLDARVEPLYGGVATQPNPGGP